MSIARHDDSFPPGVSEHLGTYVYRLIDPRNGETFYVGKGKGDRVFQHARAAVNGDEVGDKLKRIREIRLSGFEVAHVIHRHGMDDKTAFEVEAALMDAYAGLTNVAGGTGSGDRGAMHAREIISRYSAEEATFQHRCIVINVNQEAGQRSLYDAVRFAWRISRTKAAKADFVLATLRGMIVGAFVPHEWLDATPANFPDLAEGKGVKGRLGFVGEEAPGEVTKLYVGKRVPDSFRKKGAANPIRYSW